MKLEIFTLYDICTQYNIHMHLCMCKYNIYMGNHPCLMFFIFQLIRRRYFSDDLPASNPWSVSPVERPVQRLDENSSDEDQSYKKTR